MDRRSLWPNVLMTAFLLLNAGPAVAQAVGGSAEMGMDAYHVSGREPRRPGLSARLSFSPRFALWGAQIGTQFTYDTETSYAARPMNRYGLQPRWSWGQLYIGDHVPDLGGFVMSGTTLRGGGMDLTPGRFRLRLHAGRADDAVFTDPLGFGQIDDRKFNTAGQTALRRAVYGGGIRYGSERNSLELIGMFASDDPDLPDSVPVAPQENLTAGVVLAIEPVPGWRMRGEAFGSLHTLDIREETLEYEFREDLGVAGRLLDSFLDPRSGTRGDVAYRLEAEAPAPWGRMQLKVEEIGAGYSTLGVPSLPNNWRQVELGSSFRLLDGLLSGMASGGWRGDGLVDAGAGGVDRWTGMVSGLFVPGPTFSVAGSFMANRLERRAAVDTFALVNVARSASLSPRWQPRGEGPHQLSMNAALQQTDTRAGVLAPFGASTLSLGLGWDYRPGGAVSFNVAPSLVLSEEEDTGRTLFNTSAGASYRRPDSPLSLTLHGGFGNSLLGTQVQAAGTARYSFVTFGTATGRLRMTGYFGELEYREFALSLGLSRSF